MRPSDEVAIIEVQDQGTGIPEEILGRIFDPFFTTKPEGQGTGMGLAVSYGILTRHGGQIEAESQPGQGATFILSLPIEDKPAASAKESAA